MALRETYVALRVTGLEKVIFLLDASESARAHQAAIVTLVRDVLSTLPATAVPALYFLGNPTVYTPRHFTSRAVQWFQENQQRASLVTPVLETLNPYEACTIVVLGSGHLFDLEDWEGTPLLQHMLLVNMEDSLQSTLNIASEISSPTPQELLQRLHDPGVSVEIVGPGFLPIWWDNAGYRLHLVEGEASLGAERLDDFAVTIRCLATQESQIEAIVTRVSGGQAILPLDTIPPKREENLVAGLLSANEAALFHQAIRKESFCCLSCHKQHPWRTLRCLHSETLLGELVYPSLQARNVTGFVIFRIMADGVQFETHQSGVLLLGSGVVAVREGQRGVLYQYDASGERWRRMEDVLEPYHPLGEQAYAILV